MRFFADLHVHSKYSRATAHNLDLENIYITSQIKGLNLVATGDFTHPAWFDEIRNKLEPDAGGLFSLKPEIRASLNEQVPQICRRDVKFILCTEISNVYKKNGKTRKNHNLVFLPSIESAEIFNSRLARIGNIESDGRPILGLDSRDLLEIVLETDRDAFLIPAHIWTPWFSILGSKSGFDSVQECFGDLADHIFALETGLSSDPPMNWRVSSLDKYLLVSNSDAHSPSKLAREANIFNTELSFQGILSALKHNRDDRFLGTVEFYPQEGKYHIDGHRKCGFSCFPNESLQLKNICPVCGKPLTLGVLYRVEQLADRSEPLYHSNSKPFFRLIQLQDILAELLQVGSRTKKVNYAYRSLVNRFGSELEILMDIDPQELERSTIPLFKEAVEKIRKGKVIFSPGYDGVFGKLNIFSEDEKNTLLGQKVLFPIKKIHESKNDTEDTNRDSIKKRISNIRQHKEYITSLNEQQRRIIEFGLGPLLVVAGPGTGKTFTITRRIEALISGAAASKDNIMVVTFTNKAANELRERLSDIVSDFDSTPMIGTFHSICFSMLSQYENSRLSVIDDKQKTDIIGKCKVILNETGFSSNLSPARISEFISLAKLRFPVSFDGLTSDVAAEEYIEKIYFTYRDILESQGYFDYDDLITAFIRKLEKDENFLKFVNCKTEFLFIDEYQDINYPQYLLIRKLSSSTKNICAIGDPDQAIYGFRGSDLTFFKRFIEDYPEAEVFNLIQNYRSTDRILKASYSLIKDHRISVNDRDTARIYSERKDGSKVTVIKTSSERSEAVAVGRLIEELVGGSGFHSIDFDKFDYSVTRNISFGDFAVLFRTSKQTEIFEKVFSKEGIPYQTVKKQTIFEDKNVQALLALLRLCSSNGTITDLEKAHRLLKPSVSKIIVEKFVFWMLENRISLQKAVNISKKIPLKFIDVNKQKELVAFFGKLSAMKTEFTGRPVVEVLEKLEPYTRFSNSSDPADFDFKFEFLKQRAEPFGCDMESFLASIALCRDQDVYDQRSEKVALMTMHSAKGLEFPIVFVAGCEDGFLPYHAHNRRADDTDEERRLFYVSMTRAKDFLFLTYCEKRRIYGKTQDRSPSPFLKSIGKDIVYREPVKGQKPRKNGAKQLSLFDSF